MRLLDKKMNLFLVCVLSVLFSSAAFAQWNFVGGVNADPSVVPGAVSFNGKQYIFFQKTTDDDIGYITTSSGTGGSFSGVTTLATIATNPEPGAIVYQNRLFLFYGENGGSKRLFFKHMDTAGTWSAEFQVPGASTQRRPGLAVFNNKIYIFWETAGSNNNIRYVSMDFNAISAVSIVPSSKTTRAPSAAVFNGRCYLVYAGESGSIPHIWFTSMASNGTWSSEKRISGSPRTSFAPYALAVGAELHVFYTGATTYSFLRKRMNAFESWSGEEWLFGLGAFGGVTANFFGSNLWITNPGNTGTYPRSIAWITY